MSTITRADIAPGAGVPVRRRGAWFVDGAYVFTSWAPSTDAVELRLTYALAPGALASNLGVMGSVSAGMLRLVARADGDAEIEVRGGGGGTAVFADGFIQDGTPHRLVVRLGASGVEAAMLDGTDLTVSSDTLDMTRATHTPGLVYIGRAGGADSFPGVLYDVELVDLTTDANTAYFPLDTLNANGDYPNQHPDSNVGDATVTGTVLPVLINAPGGDGLPVYPAPVVVCSRLDTEFSSTAQSATITLGVTGVDLYGWITGARIDVPVAHSGAVQVTGRMRATALAAANDIEIRLRLNDGGTTYPARVAYTLDTVNKWVPFALSAVTADVGAGSSYSILFADNAAGDTIRFDDVYFTATIYPDLS